MSSSETHLSFRGFQITTSGKACARTAHRSAVLANDEPVRCVDVDMVDFAPDRQLRRRHRRFAVWPRPVSIPRRTTSFERIARMSSPAGTYADLRRSRAAGGPGSRCELQSSGHRPPPRLTRTRMHAAKACACRCESSTRNVARPRVRRRQADDTPIARTCQAVVGNEPYVANCGNTTGTPPRMGE